MNLSMSMIRWYLREYAQTANIKNDGLSIRGLRFLSANIQELHKDYMYLGNASDYISDSQYSHAYIVVHQRNYILFLDAEFEDLLNGLLSAFDYFGNWERRMFYASNAGSSLQEFIDLSYEVLCNPITVIDLEGNIAALNSSGVPEDDLYWKYKQMEGQEHPAVFSQLWVAPDGTPIHELSHTPQLVRNVQEGQAPLIMMYLFQDEEPVAVFYILIVDQELLTLDMQLAEEICKYLTFSEEFCKKNVQLRSTEKLLLDFLKQQAERDEETEAAAEKLQKAVGEGQWRLALLRHVSRNDRVFAKSTIRLLKTAEKVPCVIYEDEILFVLPETRQKEIVSALNRQMASGSYVLALSMPTRDFFSLPLRFEQARFTVSQAGERTGFFPCEEFAFPYIKGKVAQILSAVRLRHPALSILDEYDRVNHTALRETLSVFLRNKCNLLDTAKEMYVHRNTVKYRIARIQEITGVSFEDTEELQYLCVSDWVL